jgi:hypothetical protein
VESGSVRLPLGSQHVCDAVMSRTQGRGGAGGMVVQRLVQQQLRAASPARPTNGLRLWAKLGHGGPRLGCAPGCYANKRKEVG